MNLPRRPRPARLAPIILPLLLLLAATAATAAPRAQANRATPTAAAKPTATASPDPRYRIGPLLFSDDFRHGLTHWSIESEPPESAKPEPAHPARITAARGTLDIDVPAGLTLWFRPQLHGPVLIAYTATAISAGGLNDRVSDLNCFWMATDPAHPGNILASPRTGKFSDYNNLRTYYVGLGGNSNTTTRFRRYIGSPTLRPLLPQNDLRAPADLLVPNQPQQIRLIADGPLIQFFRGPRKLFEMTDPAPYTAGWFALRTVDSHLRIQHLRIYRLLPALH